jgi:hypothetical protein
MDTPAEEDTVFRTGGVRTTTRLDYDEKREPTMKATAKIVI